MTNGLSDEAIAAYAAELIDIEAEIEARQDDKKLVYGNVREAYGKQAADALKLAIKRHRMDDDKLAAAEEIDAEAERFLSVIRRPRAPRATRVASAVPHDADGVVIDDEEIGSEASADKALEAVTAPEEISRTDVVPSGDGVDMPPAVAIATNTAPRVDTDQAEPGDRGGAPREAAAMVVPDRSKPNPWCMDPEECGVAGSYEYFCQRCQRLKAERQAASAVQ